MKNKLFLILAFFSLIISIFIGFQSNLFLKAGINSALLSLILSTIFVILAIEILKLPKIIKENYAI